MSLTYISLRIIAFLMVCLSVSSFAQDMDYTELREKTAQDFSLEKNGCQSKDTDGAKHPTFIKAYGSCQIYMVAPKVRMYGDLRRAKNHPDKCMYPKTRGFNEMSGHGEQRMKFVVVQNSNFAKQKVKLESVYSHQLTPEKNPLPEEGAYYSIFNSAESDKKKTLDSYTKALEYIEDFSENCGIGPVQPTYKAQVYTEDEFDAVQ